MKNLIVYANKEFKIKKTEVHKVIVQLQKKMNFSVESLQVNFINSEQILEINKKYLNHHYTTDIITFNYSGDTRNFDGEIFISADDAKENAAKFNVDFNQEILRLITHGILHLAGYDDEQPENKKIMKKLENKYVTELTEAEVNYRVI